MVERRMKARVSSCRGAAIGSQLSRERERENWRVVMMRSEE